MASIIDEWKPLKEDVEKIMDEIGMVDLEEKGNGNTVDLTSTERTDVLTSTERTVENP